MSYKCPHKEYPTMGIHVLHNVKIKKENGVKINMIQMEHDGVKKGMHISLLGLWMLVGSGARSMILRWICRGYGCSLVVEQHQKSVSND
jgi:hypothetical protein